MAPILDHHVRRVHLDFHVKRIIERRDITARYRG